MRNGSSQSIALLPELRAFKPALIMTMQSRYYITYSNYALVTANCMNRGVGSQSIASNERPFFSDDILRVGLFARVASARP